MSKITDSARNELCQVRIPGCSHKREETVWSHGNGSACGKGLGMKAPDPIGAYTCFHCHGVYDRQIPAPKGWTRQDVEIAWWEGHGRSLAILIAKGLIKT